MGWEKHFLLAVGLLLVSLFSLSLVNSDDIMLVEANFQGYAERISIEVPDYLYLGEITKENPISEEISIKINNTGNIDVVVILVLPTGSPEVFNYLYFRKYKTSNGINVIPDRIGSYEVNVSSKSTTNFYMSLNLTDFNGTLNSNNININSSVQFFGIAK